MQRIDAAISTINGLLDSEFPYKDSSAALEKVHEIIKEARDAVAYPSQDQRIIQQASVSALQYLFDYIPLLGFILRSTNVRNAFEIHGPLLKMCRCLLGDRTRLVVSSEWDYSPMTYLGIPKMNDFVFIGFPATESANPFLIPLAGHEIGHNLWSARSLNRNVGTHITKIIQDEISQNRLADFKRLFGSDNGNDVDMWSDLFRMGQIAPATTWGVLQAEETFCDLVGLRIFGVTFLHAFVYLLSPGLGSRDVAYPSVTTRMQNLLDAARSWDVTVPEEYASVFRPDQTAPLTHPNRFLLDLSEFAVNQLVPSLRDAAHTLVREKLTETEDSARIREIRRRIELTVPAEDAKSLVNILAAAWEALRDRRLWEDKPHWDSAMKHDHLKEIVLKSIEILDIHTRTQAGTA